MDLEAIWKRARADLLIPNRRGDPDLFLWEHSFRVARTAQYLLHLPEVRKRAPDDCAVLAAALYHNAGWVSRYRGADADRLELLLGSLSEGDDEEGAHLMERSLSGLLPAGSLQLAAHVTRAVRDRATDLVEAHVVSDANNLQEFGVLYLWPAIRRGLLDGKGVQALLDTWRRKKEYRFWEARLTDSFRFQASREIARSRLEKIERLLAELEEQHNASDVAAIARVPHAASR